MLNKVGVILALSLAMSAVVYLFLSTYSVEEYSVKSLGDVPILGEHVERLAHIGPVQVAVRQAWKSREIIASGTSDWQAIQDFIQYHNLDYLGPYKLVDDVQSQLSTRFPNATVMRCSVLRGGGNAYWGKVGTLDQVMLLVSEDDSSNFALITNG